MEPGGRRISALLNPESLETRRTAGLRSRQGATGVLTGRGRSDDPLIATGGGVTELDLQLLFDTEIAMEGRAPGSAAAASTSGAAAGAAAGAASAASAAGAAAIAEAPSPPAITDVRELTRPLWDLAENARRNDGWGAPPTVRFIWGRSWNMLAVVVAAAERLERFDADGAPRRSWLSLRLRRVDEDAEAETPVPPSPPTSRQFESPSGGEEGGGRTLEVPRGPDGRPLTRLDVGCALLGVDPRLRRSVAEEHGMDDLMQAPPGGVLRAGRPPGDGALA